MEAENKEEKGNFSATSSPSHEFSFTISLHHSSSSTTTSPPSLLTTTEKIKQPLAAIDLTPADEIFFHGHLLPLHFLSHLHAASSSSPRLSTNSMDGFTLPIRDMLHEEEEEDLKKTLEGPKEGRKPFSLFGLSKWRKGSESKERETNQEDHQHDSKKKLKFDVMSQFVKRYVKFLTPKGGFSGSGRGRREGVRFRRQTYSFSPREKREIVGRRGGELFSAPASMRASPTNSGVLLATATATSTLPSSDSTMEELQSAIQAAIAHCKNSIASEKKPQDLSVSVN